MKQEPQRLLVTGGAGFMGSNFVHWVVRNHSQVRVTVLDALTYAANERNLEGLPSRSVSFVHGDIRDRVILEHLVSQVDAIVHFAAESHNDESIEDPARFVASNIVGTFELLEAARRHDVRFHHVSTDEVFGALSISPHALHDAFTERSPYRPSSPYSATKAASDLLVGAWCRTYGLRATISNSANNFGPRQHIEKFIPRQITNLLTGRPLALYGDGENVRDWLHVDDHSSAVWAILTQGTVGESYLVSACCEKSNLEVAHALLRIMGGSESDIRKVRDRPGHDARYASDASKLRNQLNWAPVHIDFEAALTETARWYADHREWWEPQKAAVEERYNSRGQ